MRPVGTETEENTAGSYLYNNVNLFTRNVKTNTGSLFVVSMVGGAKTNTRKPIYSTLVNIRKDSIMIKRYTINHLNKWEVQTFKKTATN
jgi:hypothetical protein